MKDQWILRTVCARRDSGWIVYESGRGEEEKTRR